MDFQSKVSKSKSQSELKELVASFNDNIEVRIKDLTAVLKDSILESFFTSLKSRLV